MPLLLTADEAASLLRVHVNTVKYLIRNGQLGATKVGRAWRIPRESVRNIADCDRGDSSIDSVAKRLFIALKPFGRLKPTGGNENQVQSIPTQWIERARSAISEAEALELDDETAG